MDVASDRRRVAVPPARVRSWNVGGERAASPGGSENRFMKFFRDAWPVVVIVATIAGAAWTAAWNVRDFLTARIAASETGLAAQIAASENRLAARIVASENRLAENDAHLAGQIAELRQYLVDHLGDHAGRGSTPSLARGAMLRTEERAGTDATARLPAVQVLRAGNRTEERAGTDATAGGGRRCPRGPGADADDQRRRRPCPDSQPAGPPGASTP